LFLSRMKSLSSGVLEFICWYVFSNSSVVLFPTRFPCCNVPELASSSNFDIIKSRSEAMWLDRAFVDSICRCFCCSNKLFLMLFSVLFCK
jgi:hypothetical protein